MLSPWRPPHPLQPRTCPFTGVETEASRGYTTAQPSPKPPRWWQGAGRWAGVSHHPLPSHTLLRTEEGLGALWGESVTFPFWGAPHPGVAGPCWIWVVEVLCPQSPQPKALPPCPSWLAGHQSFMPRGSRTLLHTPGLLLPIKPPQQATYPAPGGDSQHGWPQRQARPYRTLSGLEYMVSVQGLCLLLEDWGILPSPGPQCSQGQTSHTFCLTPSQICNDRQAPRGAPGQQDCTSSRP